MDLSSYIKLARPSHWIKNIVVVFPVIFGRKYGDVNSWGKIAAVTAAFCLVSSFVYIVNDIADCEYDKKHPFKKNRPIASGKVSKLSALIESMLFLAGAAGMFLLLRPVAVFAVLAYLTLQLAYIYCFKHRVLIDVISISMGFVLRAAAGALAISVMISPWLFICMFTVFLFMGFCKRYNEQMVISDVVRAKEHRRTLLEYTPEFLTHLITTSAGIAIVAFLSYSLSSTTIERFGNTYFVYTLPLLVYAVFRFAMLSMRGIYSGPTEIIFKDRPFEIATGLWALAMLGIILFASEINDGLAGLS